MKRKVRYKVSCDRCCGAALPRDVQGGGRFAQGLAQDAACTVKDKRRSSYDHSTSVNALGVAQVDRQVVIETGVLG